jgi:hypothetical protein
MDTDPRDASGPPLVFVTTRKPTGVGRPDPKSVGYTVYRLHRADCRYAHGPGARSTTFDLWQQVVETSRTDDDCLLCKVCRPEEKL